MKYLPSLAAAAALLLPLPSQAAVEHYTLDPAHTNIVWHANHFGFSTPSGKFPDVSGTLDLDEKDPSKSAVEVTVGTASLVTGSEKFDTHLKSLDFLNVEKYPLATFKSTGVTQTGPDTAKVAGQLTMLGVTMPLTLDVKLNKIGESPVSKKKTAGFTINAVLKRSDYGMTYGIPGVSDEVKLTIESEANLAEPAK